jgi:hypothetical protein
MMHKSRPARALLALGGLLGGLAAAAAPATAATAATSATAAWAAACQVQGSPQPVSPSSNTNNPQSVAVINGCDAWLVGIQLDKSLVLNQFLTEHFDGTAWKEVPVGRLDTLGAELNGVSAVSTSSVYAVGEFSTPKHTSPVVEHWNGTAWVPDTHLGVIDAELDSVHAASDNDIWVSGSILDLIGNERHGLLLHWDGSTWTRTTIPAIGDPDDDIRVLSVSATSPNNAWAIAQDFTGVDRAFILHWDGQQWTQSPFFLPRDQDVDLNTVTTSSTFDAWGVGSIGSDATQTLTLRWNGHAWTRVASPSPGTDAFLLGVSSTSRLNAWAVGRFTNGDEADALLLQWDGHQWTQVATPSPGRINQLNAVAADTPSDFWAVGTTQGSNGLGRAFAVHGP